MKCKYCNADIEQDAQFCTNCGKDLSKFNRCVKCGELLDSDTVFCPYCGTKQSKKDEVKEQNVQKVLSQESQPETVDDTLQSDEEISSKKWVWIVLSLILLAAIVGGGYYFYDMNSRNKVLVAESDSTIIEVVDSTRIVPDTAIEFIESMYKDFFENKNFDTENISNLHKYLSPSVAKKLKFECPYDGGEGEFSYVVYFFCDGSLSYERPDFGDKVVSRTIEPENDGWFKVTNIWDTIKEPVIVHLQVKSVDGVFKIVDFRNQNEKEAEELSDSSTEPVISIFFLNRIF